MLAGVARLSVFFVSYAAWNRERELVRPKQLTYKGVNVSWEKSEENALETLGCDLCADYMRIVAT